jgi:phosphoglycerol transferase MdoB-like AlkP superfamily enzyme
MRQRLLILLKSILFWLAYFILLRAIFIIYNYDFTKSMPFADIIGSFVHGFKLDMSQTGYVIFFLSFFLAFFIPFGEKINSRFIKIYTFIFIFLFTIISIVDIELYKNWGFKIDTTVLLYLKTPKESLASTPVWLTLLLALLSGVIIWTANRYFNKFIKKDLKKLKPSKWYFIPVMLFIAATMIIPIRGGFGIAPINPGTVFFSEHQFANHAAINTVWNFGYSLAHDKDTEQVKFMNDEVAHKYVSGLLSPGNGGVTKLIKDDNPNVLIIILESFTANIIEPLGGVKDVTPNFTGISKNGVFFDNFYASGDRSDKGIVAILSGYPAQPTSSIIKFTNKAEKLPHLSKMLEKDGYSTGFYYGGEINFANMNSYFVSGGYDTLVTLHNFSKKDMNSKWGAHDHVVFQRLFDDLQKTEQPFFRVMFTLSSHEPFDVPHTSKFKGTDNEQKFFNAANYTDSCLGDFIDKAKLTSWWNNTWIILVADHGIRLVGNIPYNSSQKFRIPMVWTGGAVIKDTVISKTASQCDIPLMIGNQTNKNFKNFYFSKDVLKNQNAFAYFAYNNGFGFYTDTAGFVWDNTGNKFIEKNNISLDFEQKGKAFLQVLLEDFNKK